MCMSLSNRQHIVTGLYLASLFSALVLFWLHIKEVDLNNIQHARHARPWYPSWYSDPLWARWFRACTHVGRRDSSPPCQSTPAMGPTQPLLHWKPHLFLEVQWLGCGINDQPTPSIDVKNVWSCSNVLALTCYGVIFIRHSITWGFVCI
jgi:hypothetical protein